MARIAAFVIGGIAIALAIPAQKLNIAFLVALAFAVAASANLPSILYNLFWKRFNTRGATWAIYGGLISCVVLVFFSPVVSGLGVNPVTGATCRCSRRRRLPLVPAGEPRHHLHPARASSSAGWAPSRPRSRKPRSGSPSSRSAPSPAPAPSRPAATRDLGGTPIRLRSHLASAPGHADDRCPA